MRAWRCVGALLLVVAAGVAVTASEQQGGDKPTFKAFDEANKSFWQELKTDTDQKMTVQGMTVEQKQRQTFYVKWTTKEVKGNKSTVEYEIVGVKMDITIGGNQISFDSTKDKSATPQNPLTDFFGALIGSKFTLTVTKDDAKGVSVTDVEGLDKFVERLTAANDALKPLLKNILTKEAIQQMSNPTFAAFPPSEKEWAASTWTFPVTLNMGPIGSYDTTYIYTVDAKDKTKINVSGKMVYKAPDAKEGAGLPFKVGPKSKLEADNISGYVTLVGGRVADSSIKMDLKGELFIDIAGMETKVDLTQKQTSTVKTRDEEPPELKQAVKK